jgi:predicted nucleotidyltransferase
MGDLYKACCEEQREKQLMPKKAFLTGSVVYGDPHREDSSGDIDLVIRIDHDDVDTLANHAESLAYNDYNTLHAGLPMYFGTLNLICCVTDESFAMWKQGTEELKLVAPVTREQACEHFAKLRNKLNE